MEGTKKSQCHEIKGILCCWYQKCSNTDVYPDRAMLQEEALLIEQRLDNNA